MKSKQVAINQCDSGIYKFFKIQQMSTLGYFYFHEHGVYCKSKHYKQIFSVKYQNSEKTEV